MSAYYPVWSPDGKAIVFVARRGDDGSVDLYSIDPAGGVPDRLTNTPERIESRPTFSPDGEFIAFAESDGAHIDIYKMQRDGTDVTLLTKAEDDERDFDPAWSPDGQYIAFWTQASFGGQPADSEEIYVMKPDGSERQQIIQHGCYPAWRPIGGDMRHN